MKYCPSLSLMLNLQPVSCPSGTNYPERMFGSCRDSFTSNMNVEHHGSYAHERARDFLTFGLLACRVPPFRSDEKTRSPVCTCSIRFSPLSVFTSVPATKQYSPPLHVGQPPSPAAPAPPALLIALPPSSAPTTWPINRPRRKSRSSGHLSHISAMDFASS